ncbi:MAG: hypothetical protein AAF411_15265 [Myxococcota bacterium]
MKPLLALALLAAACGSDASANEARLLLDRIDGLGTPDLVERRRRIEAFEAMPLRDPRAVELRDACAPMHAALLVADESAVEAREAVDARAEGDGEAGQRAIAALARGQEAVEQVQQLRDGCQSRLDQFNARYTRRRER